MENDTQEEQGITRSIRSLPPSHHLFKIKSFSLLVEEEVEKYKSDPFEVGGHQWRLVLYPTGDKKSNGNGYISLNLEIKKKANESLDWEVNVEFKLFVFDQTRDQYLVVKDMEVPFRRFYEMKTEWGFSQFLLKETFNDETNGFLVDDCCIFGAEVFVIERPPNLEQSSITRPTSRTITWKIDNFSKLDEEEYYKSPANFVQDIKWNFLVYPKGDSSCKGNSHLSIYLTLAEPDTLPPKHEIFVKWFLRLRDQIGFQHLEFTSENQYSSSNIGWGCVKFVSLKDLYDSSKGYMVKDSIIVEAEFILISRLE